MEKKPEITFWKVFSNFSILKDLTYLQIRSPSTTQMESFTKNEEFDKIKKYMKRSGSISLFLSFSGMAYFFMKTSYYKTKLFLGFLYFMNSSHIYVLGSHVGILLGLKKTIKNLYAIDVSSDENLLFKKHIDKIFIDNQSFDIQEFYKEKFKERKEFNKIMKNSFVENEYFFKNADQYKDDKENSDYYHIIPSENFQVKGPIYDCFLTRYVFNYSRRFLKKYFKFED